MSPATKQQVNDLQQTVDQLGEYMDMKFDDAEERAKEAAYARAAADSIEAANQIAEAGKLFMKGDTVAGVGALLNGLGGIVSAIGSLTAVLGPLGPIFSVLTGVIAAILKFFEPEPKSLADQVKDIVGQNALDEMRKNLTADDAVWTIMTGGLASDGRIAMLGRTRQAITYAATTNTEFKFDEETMAWPLGYDDEFRYKPDGTARTAQEKLAVEAADMAIGMSWERIQNETNIEHHLQFMLAAIAYLGGFKGDKLSEEWVALGNATAAYTLRMWLYIHQFVGLMSPDSVGEFTKMRNNLVKALMVAHEEGDIGDSVATITKAVQCNGSLYARWEYADKGTFEMAYNMFQRRDGVIGEVGDFADAGYRTTNFAVSSRRTLFACSTDGKATAGGHGTWTERDEQPFGQNQPEDDCAEVFAGEPANPDLDGKVIVAYRDGRPSKSRLALCVFDDTVGGGDDGAGEWTPNQGRWGAWKTWTFDFRVASVAFTPPLPGDGYELYVLAMNDDMSMTLRHLTSWDDGATVPVDGFSWTADQVKAANGWNIVANSFWPLSCAISPDPFSVQVGNSVRIRNDDGSIAEWDLAAMMQDASLKVHQGRFYADGTFVACSNLGLHQRRWGTDGEYVWDHDLAIETTCAQKIPMAEAGTWVKLMARCHGIQQTLQ